MWTMFFACMALCVLVLYVPGALVFRTLGFDLPFSVALAPLISLAFYGLLPIAYWEMGVGCSWATVFVPALVVCLLVFAFAKVFRGSAPRFPLAPSPFWIFLLYSVFGLMICLYAFIKPLDGPASFYCRADNMMHLNEVRFFLESGGWSSLHASTGALSLAESNGWFYPSLWADLASLVASMANCDPIIAINAVNAVVCAIVFPSSMYALIRTLFPNSKKLHVYGIVLSMSFGAFPWSFLIKGPLVSNLLAYSIMPGALAAFIAYCSWGLRRHWRAVAITGLAAFASMALAQPNALFSALVFLVPFLCHRLALRFPARRGVVWIVGTAAAAAVWWGLQQLPFLYETVYFPNDGGLNLTVGQSIVGTMKYVFYVNQPPQILLAILSLVGVIVLFRKGSAWLSLPGIYMLVAYTISRCTDLPIRNYFCGFWYNDPWRLSDCAAIFLIPVVLVGFAWIVDFVCKKAESLRFVKTRETRPGFVRKCYRIVSVVLILLFCLVNYFPSFRVPGTDGKCATAFGFVHDRLKKEYKLKPKQVYGSDEQEFVKKVMEVIPEGAVVINMPDDGSVFAYGVNGLNTYYRSNALSLLNEDATLIRTSLDQVADNARVLEATEDIPSCYVLLLDQGVSFEDGKWLIQITEERLSYWDGIQGITDETPGFEVVLSEGDMRLYQVAVE